MSILIDEVGTYKTRDGRVVQIDRVMDHDDIDSPHPCRGTTPDGCWEWWRSDGKYNSWREDYEGIDIVEKVAQQSPVQAVRMPGTTQEMMEREAIKTVFTHAVDQLPDACLPFASILAEAVELHARKSRDYGSDQDPYANVRASEEFGIPAWTGAVLRSNDKITRLKQFSKKGSLANESAEDSLLDLCVYFPIALMLYRQASQGATNQPVVD